jgi:outer membrane protein assembly factor BamB
MRFRAVCGILAAALAAAAADWPQFRGAHGRGIAAEGNPPVEFGLQKGLIWKVAVPAGHSSPSVWGDRIFLTAGDKGTNKLETFCIGRKDGKLLWRRELTAEKIERLHAIGNPASATALADGERVYAYFASHGLVSFDFAGDQQWTLPLPVPAKFNGSGTSPILAGDYVILNRDDPEEAYLLAVDRRTGKVAWKQSYGEPAKNPGAGNTSTPVIWNDEIVVHRSSELAAFDQGTGEKRWWVNVSSTGVGSPVDSPEAIYVSTWFNTGEPDLRVPPPEFAALLANDKDGDGAIGPEEFPAQVSIARRPDNPLPGVDLNLPGKMIFARVDQNKDGKVEKSEWDGVLAMIRNVRDHGLLAIKAGGKGDVTATHVLWRESRSVAEVPSPIFSKGRVYMVTNGGIVTCLDGASGKLLFRSRLGAGGAYFSSPVVAAGSVYSVSSEGVVTVIRDSGEFEVLARSDLREQVFTTPAIVSAAIYIRTASHLYAFGR